MEPKSVVVLGGYGQIGETVVRQLLAFSDARVTVAGRKKDSAEALARTLDAEYPGRVASLALDMARTDGLATALRGADLIVNLTPLPQSIPALAAAALEIGADYSDISIQHVLQGQESAIAASGRCFVVQCGFHPGLPATMVRHVAPHFDALARARVFMAMDGHFTQPESAYELVDEVGRGFEADVLEDGAWRKSRLLDGEPFDFGARFGRMQAVPFQMAEILALPRMYPSLRQLGVYVTGFNWLVDMVLIPLVMLAYKIKPGLGRETFARWIYQSVARMNPGNRGVVMVLDGHGTKDGRPRHVRLTFDHPSAHAFTAAPLVGLLLQRLDGTIHEPGLWMMGHVCDPGRVVEHLVRSGTTVTLEIDGQRVS